MIFFGAKLGVFILVFVILPLITLSKFLKEKYFLKAGVLGLSLAASYVAAVALDNQLSFRLLVCTISTSIFILIAIVMLVMRSRFKLHTFLGLFGGRALGLFVSGISALLLELIVIRM